MVSEKDLKVAILCGITAGGKSDFAMRFCKEHPDLNLEIINADSIQVYRDFDRGSAKPTKREQREVPHHLVDVLGPEDQFTAGDFVRLAEEKIKEIHSRNARALIVGGTGFYIRALTHGVWPTGESSPEFREKLEKIELVDLFEDLIRRDPETANRIGPKDRYRIERALEIIETSGKTPQELEAEHAREGNANYPVFWVDRENAEIEKRIRSRVTSMLEDEWVNEVKSLLSNHPHAWALKSVGYRQVVSYLRGEKPKGRKLEPGIEGLKSEIELATRQLVKKQRTWFNGQNEPKRILFPDQEGDLWRELESIYS